MKPGTRLNQLTKINYRKSSKEAYLIRPDSEKLRIKASKSNTRLTT